MLPNLHDYAELSAAFRWDIPAFYNIGTAIADRWARREPHRLAILEVLGDGAIRRTDYASLRGQSNRLASSLARLGLARGDRIAILLPQMAEVAVCHAAIYKLGAIALPLAALFGPDALRYRLGDASVRALITNAAGYDKIAPLRADLPALELIVSTDGRAAGAESFQQCLARGQADFEAVATRADDPALMIYTSGTTGPPKGALHAHRVLLGHLPGVQFSHEFLPQAGDRLWTPADWAWAGGLLNVLLPGLHLGVPVVAASADRFDPERAVALMVDTAVRNAFIPPTALRMLRGVFKPADRGRLVLRTLSSGGESLGAETHAWGLETLGLAINEFYGQTECNYVLSSCGRIGVSRPGAIGKPVPGHNVAVITAAGTACAPDEMGQIAVKRPDPAMFLGYWNNAAATRQKFIGDWMTTGDQGMVDADGYIRFFGRDDDVITSSGYRIGPGEIEDCLLRHSAVALAAAVGKPDALRTEIIKAYVVLRAGVQGSPELASDIQAFVRRHLSAHEYPREIAFIDALPLTTTGKIIRRLLRDAP
jgi:acetyl-CoA synthetase